MNPNAPTERQLIVLRQHNIDASNMSKQEASKTIAALAANDWAPLDEHTIATLISPERKI